MSHDQFREWLSGIDQLPRRNTGKPREFGPEARRLRRPRKTAMAAGDDCRCPHCSTPAKAFRFQCWPRPDNDRQLYPQPVESEPIASPVTKSPESSRCRVALSGVQTGPAGPVAFVAAGDLLLQDRASVISDGGYGPRYGNGPVMIPRRTRCETSPLPSWSMILDCAGNQVPTPEFPQIGVHGAGPPCFQQPREVPHEISRSPAPVLRRTVTTGKRKITKRVHTCRWVEDVPVRSGAGAFRVTWIGHEISDPASGKIRQSSARITNLPVHRHNVREIAECGRARWKVENEGFNVLKQGCNLDRNFGHGSENLASVLLVLNLLAFAMHAACDLAERTRQDARQAAGSRDRMFRQLQVLTARIVFDTWRQLLDVVADKIEIPP